MPIGPTLALLGYMGDSGKLGSVRGDGLRPFQREAIASVMARFRWLAGYREPGLWWFRVWGYGLAWKDIYSHPLLFSQRRRRWTRLLVGRWCFQLLRRGH